MSAAPPLWRWRLFIFWLIVALAAGIVEASLPLLESIGYESSLFAALICSLAAGHLAACYPGRARALSPPVMGGRFPLLVIYFKAAVPGLLVTAVPLVVSLVNGLWVPFCNLKEGLAFYLLMPVFSALFASAVGLVVGLATRRSRVAAALFVVLFLLGLFGALMSFYATPAVYIFNPFFGYFPGVLYDRLVQVEARLVTYRLTTICQVVAILAAAHLLLDASSLRLRLAKVRAARGRWLLAAGALVAALALHGMGSRLGHRAPREDLEEHLDKRVSTGRLDLFFPEGTDGELVEALTRDAEFSLFQVERYLALRCPGRIAVFFFADAADKGATIGAADTNVAKPWRREVYVVVDEVPHMVLRHELAHVVAGAAGRPPFAIAGKLLGLFPSPGLIEGVAMAAGGPRGDLTLHQWAAAMGSAKLLPPLEQLFGLGFFDLSAGRAYTAAGSFCAWLRETLGPGVLKQAYRTADIEAAAKKPFAELEASWLAFLDTVQRSDADIAAAEYRFDRPSVIGTACVHEVERICVRARRLSSLGEHEKALSLYRSAYERSQRSTATKRERFYALANAGDSEALRREAAALLEDPAMGKVDRHAIRELLADLNIARSAPGGAAAIYRELARDAKSDAERRRLEVKAHLADLEPPVPAQLFDVLALRPGPRAVSPPLAALLLADAASARPRDPVLAYLHLRQYFLEREWETALCLIDTINTMDLTAAAPSLGVTLRMMRGRALFALERLDEARFQFKAIARDPGARLGQRAVAEDWAERVDFEASR